MFVECCVPLGSSIDLDGSVIRASVTVRGLRLCGSVLATKLAGAVMAVVVCSSNCQFVCEGRLALASRGRQTV